MNSLSHAKATSAERVEELIGVISEAVKYIDQGRPRIARAILKQALRDEPATTVFADSEV